MDGIFRVEIPPCLASFFGSLQNNKRIYAEYEVSRTPDAQQRPQEPPEPQRQNQTAPLGERFPRRRHRRQKRRGRQAPARRPFGLRQSRQGRRLSLIHISEPTRRTPIS